jgi:hypothetical protein
LPFLIGHLFAAFIENFSRDSNISYFDTAASNICPSTTTTPKPLQLSLDYSSHIPGRVEQMKWSGAERRKLSAEN